MIKIITALFASVLVASAALQSDPITITGIQPVGGNSGLRIEWAGGIPPYKLQIAENITGEWRDASYHIYANSTEVRNISPLAFFRVRSIPDRTPPPAMTGFGPRQVECREVHFSWDSPGYQDPIDADAPGGTGLRGYCIYRDGIFLEEVPFPLTTFIDVRALPGTTYLYQATAIDYADNESPRSGMRVVNTPPCASSPPEVNVTVSWDPSPGPGVAGYILYFGLVSGEYTEVFDVGDVTNATVRLISGLLYYFAVSAYNEFGAEGRLSDETFYQVP